MTKATYTLKTKYPVCRLSAMILSGILFILAIPRGATTSEPHEVPLDGLASVISFSSNDESSAVLILDSDLELIARILLVTHHGVKWQDQPVDNVVKFKARRLAIVIRLLAHVATQVGEKVDTVRRDKWVARFSTMAGGKAAVQILLQQSGASQRELSNWFSNLQLCRIQLQYMSDKIRMPDDVELQKMFQQGDHLLVGAPWEEAQNAFKKIIRNKKLQQVIAEWLARFEQQGNIRFP